MSLKVSINKDLDVINEERLKETVEHIRESSAKGRFVKYTSLYQEPISLNDREIEGFIEAIDSLPDYEDIALLKGKEEKYYYSREKMTESYAKMVYRVEENDLIKLMAETIRRESEIYPRPTAVSLFYERPFSFSDEMIKTFVKNIQEDAQFSDIKESKATNGALYLYSDKHLTEDHAKALTEWIEVIQYENP